MHIGKRKDGTPLQPGDRVIAFYENGNKCAGTVKNIKGPFIFQSLKGAKLQTYTISGFDGKERPAHAWNIKPLKKRKS